MSDINKNYNEYQINEYKKVWKLMKLINSTNPHAIDIAVYMVGESLYKYSFTKCPFCGGHDEKKIKRKDFKVSYWKYHVIKPNNNDYNYYISCSKCTKRMDLYKFVAEQCKVSYKDAVYKLAELLVIDTDNIDISDVEMPAFFKLKEGETIIQKKTLPEIDLSKFGFSEDRMHPSFFRWGVTTEDIQKFDVRYTGRECHNYMKDRVCFPVKDVEGRVVGVIGKSVFSKQEYYDYMIKKHKLLGIPERKKQEERVDSIQPYIENMFSEGFDRNFAIYNADKVFSDGEETKLFICKTPLDVLHFNHTSLKQAVALLQDDFSNGQLYILFDRYKVVRTKINIYLCFKELSEKDAVKRNAKRLYELGFKKYSSYNHYY